jgi:hypothetical protein
MVSWYLIEHACFSAISAVSRSPTMRGGLDARRHDLIVDCPHAIKLELGHQLETRGAFGHDARRRLS